MSDWVLQNVRLRYQLSDWTLGSVALPLQVRSEAPFGGSEPSADPCVPHDALLPGSYGYLIRGLPLAKELPAFTNLDDYVRYAPLQYKHCFIDLRMTFEDYAKTFSAKTRSTIRRKVKRFAKHSGGQLSWKTYRTPEEIADFFGHARRLSALTYQERLLDAGIPSSATYLKAAQSLAESDSVRAYLLFHGEQPVSYLYCPSEAGILQYAYLGYDPDYMKYSVGTVLQWVVVEQLMDEARFQFFDFTEGDSNHKLLFSTDQRLRANVYFVRRTLKSLLVLRSHHLQDRASARLGHLLDSMGLKARVKRLLRFSR